MNDNLRLKAGTIKHLQKYVAEKIKQRGFEDETLHERLILLVEEIGELASACRKISGMNVDAGRNIKYSVGEEIADVINLVFVVGIKLGVDVEKEFFKKESQIDKRSYKRSTEKHEK